PVIHDAEQVLQLLEGHRPLPSVRAIDEKAALTSVGAALDYFNCGCWSGHRRVEVPPIVSAATHCAFSVITQHGSATIYALLLARCQIIASICLRVMQADRHGIWRRSCGTLSSTADVPIGARHAGDFDNAQRTRPHGG